MRNLSLLLALFPLFACSGGKDTGGDTNADADTDTDTDADVDFQIVHDADGSNYAVSGNCAGNACDYTITTTKQAAVVDLDMTETGDSYLYHEYHDEFVLDSTNPDGSEVYALHLDVVTDLADVGNGTTLFYGDVINRTTWLFAATDSAGTTDCVVTGDDTSYYSNACSNVN